jgi:hypothetical protein
MNVLSCQEPEDFLQFFDKGFAIVHGPRVPVADLNKRLQDQGGMFRI